MRYRLGFGSLVALGMLVGFAPISKAEPVTWYLKDVALQGGGSMVGNLVYDADTNTVSSWFISSSADAPNINCPPAGCVWTSATDVNSIFGIYVVADSPTFTSFALGTIDNESLLIALAGQLTDAGGTVPMWDLRPTDATRGIPATLIPY